MKMIPRSQCTKCYYRLPLGGVNYCQYILVEKERRPRPEEPGVCPVRKESRKPAFKTNGSGLY